LNELGRYYYVTPTSYLELISTFITLLNERRGEVSTARSRYQVGLDKLMVRVCSNVRMHLSTLLTPLTLQMLLTLLAHPNLLILQPLLGLLILLSVLTLLIFPDCYNPTRRLEKNRGYLVWHTTFMLRALEWSDHNKDSAYLCGADRSPF
jgi:hypothetical protein